MQFKHLGLLLAFILTVPMDGLARDVTDPYYDQRGDSERNELEYVEGEKWKEAGTELPPLPKDEDLVEVPLDHPPIGMKLYIDPDLVFLDMKDRVLRYWAVLKSRSGAYNAMFEGMRCSTHEFKVYGYGHPHRKPQVRKAKDPQWKLISEVPGNDYHRELEEFFLCNGTTPFKPAQVADLIKGGYQSYNPFTESTDM